MLRLSWFYSFLTSRWNGWRPTWFGSEWGWGFSAPQQGTNHTNHYNNHHINGDTYNPYNSTRNPNAVMYKVSIISFESVRSHFATTTQTFWWCQHNFLCQQMGCNVSNVRKWLAIMTIMASEALLCEKNPLDFSCSKASDAYIAIIANFVYLRKTRSCMLYEQTPTCRVLCFKLKYISYSEWTDMQ